MDSRLTEHDKMWNFPTGSIQFNKHSMENKLSSNEWMIDMVDDMVLNRAFFFRDIAIFPIISNEMLLFPGKILGHFYDITEL